MRIFYAFLIMMISAILWMIPMTQAIYDFRTDLRTDTFSASTAGGLTSANVTLLEDLYDCDMGSIGISSNSTPDVPLPNSINCTSRLLNIDGLAENITRTLDVSYDVDALPGAGAIGTLLGWLPLIWILVIIAFPMAALFAIFTGRV